MAGALTGIRVLDLTSVVMGPMATQILGDLGADVITVESAGGETNRVMGPGPHPALSGTSLNLLRSKRNIALDLKHPDGRDVLMRLAATCDVFVTNLRPSSLGRLRLTYDEVRCARPDVVYCQAQGFPADTDRANDPAYDDIIQSATGVADAARRAYGEPRLVPTLVADKVAGLTIVYTVLAALFHRERSGEGQHIEVPMAQAVTAFMLVEHGAGGVPQPPAGPAGYQRILTPERRPQRTADGWINADAGEPPGAAPRPAQPRGPERSRLFRLRHRRPPHPGRAPHPRLTSAQPPRRLTSPSAMTFAVAGVYLLDAVSQDVRWTMEGCLMEITNLGQADGLPPVDWAAVAEKLDAGSAPAPDAANSRTTWLSTVNEDGSPHVTPVGAMWLDGTFWFQTGAGTRKGRNVARDPRCSIAVSIRDADVVIEGDAARVTEPGALARIAKAWADNGWPAEPDDSGLGITAPFNAPSLGPPPWNVYRIEPRSAIVAVAAEPGGLTRFRF